MDTLTNTAAAATNSFAADFAKDLAKTLALNTAATAGVLTGFCVSAVAFDQLKKVHSNRAEKKAAKAAAKTESE